MNNESNEKLVLWGHIIVLLLIFIVGFGMMFNVVSYEKKLEKEDILLSNNTQFEELNTFEKKCNNNETCLKNNIYEFSVIKENILLCDIFVDSTNILSCYENYFSSFQEIKPISCSSYDKSQKICNSYVLKDIFENETIKTNCQIFETNEDKINCYESYIIETQLFENPISISCDIFFNEIKFNDCLTIKKEYENREKGEYTLYCTSLKDFYITELCNKKSMEDIIY